jgi:hypothetical protein
LSLCNNTCRVECTYNRFMENEKTSAAITRFRTRLLRTLSLPEDALPGSLSMTTLKCGKKQCHCMSDEGKKHTAWALTYMSEGKKVVRHIPSDLVEYVQEKVAKSKEFRETLNQVLVANADLLLLRRKQKKK